jgi:restriction system protein
MELSPGGVESLITNLFQRMGLDTKLSQASRDGGVDCVAFDSPPILGGKVVIQAKRYKNTVGVSSVRDLFGTVHNEGASKGILVTTSGYGKAACGTSPPSDRLAMIGRFPSLASLSLCHPTLSRPDL